MELLRLPQDLQILGEKKGTKKTSQVILWLDKDLRHHLQSNNGLGFNYLSWRMLGLIHNSVIKTAIIHSQKEELLKRIREFKEQTRMWY